MKCEEFLSLIQPLQIKFDPFLMRFLIIEYPGKHFLERRREH